MSFSCEQHYMLSEDVCRMHAQTIQLPFLRAPCGHAEPPKRSIARSQRGDRGGNPLPALGIDFKKKS